MNPRNHQIGKLVLKLEFDSEQAANELQKTFTGTFENQVKQALDEVFSTFSNNGETIVIDHLKINLGKINFEDFATRLKNEIKHYLQKLLITETKEEISDEFVKIQASKTKFEILTFFLQNGYYPWWASEITVQQLETDVINETKFENRNIQTKFSEVLASTTCRQRLSVQFSEDFNRQLIMKFYPETADFIFRTIEEIRIFLTGNRISDKEITCKWPVLVWPLLFDKEELDVFQKQFPTKIFLVICEKLNLNFAGTLAQLQNLPEFEPDFQDNLINPDKKSEQISQKKPEKKEQSTTEILIANAGMVIFWPYLQQLFRDFNLMQGTEFINEKHLEKAVLLTQFLVNGEFETEEFQLPLNKILCGWPIEKPVGKVMIFEENEKAIVEDFLKEIIKNWPALKNTSIAGLRETFLQRNGILRESQQKWTLKIERKTVDILRDSLPWPISIIKLPWMNKILYVEW